MIKILKRLELIKTAVVVEDEEIIELQIAKLETLDIDDKVKHIILSLKNKNYQRAVEEITSYSMGGVITENYVVSLVDILGQKSKLNTLNSLDIAASGNEVLKTLRETYGKIKKFREHVYGATAWLDGITRFDDANQDSNEIKISSYSDMVVSYVSLRDDTNKVSLKGVYYLLFANGLVFLQMLSEGTPVRGGIDLGIGIEHNNGGCNELYGSALSNPYNLESSVALYPRIVIGGKLFDFINNLADDTDELFNDSISHNIYFAKMCIEIIKKDCDGEYILDYLSDPFSKMESFDFHKYRAEEFIKKQKLYFEDIGATKEAKKYKSIIEYFEKER